MSGFHPKHEPTDETRARLRELLAAGNTRDAAAEALGVSHDTLRRRYADVLADFPAPPPGAPEGRRFRPGQSGNPSGMSSTVAAAMQEARGEALEMIRIIARGAKDETADWADRIRAASYVADRAMGKATQPLNLKADHDGLDDDGLDAAIRAEALRLGIDLAHVPPVADAAGGEGEAHGGEGTARVH